METAILVTTRKQFEYYKLIGEKTMAQLTEEQLFWQYNKESNSIAMVVQHLVGNMRSRWTDFMTTDGEKEWRNRDAEFEQVFASKEALLLQWEQGWQCLFTALDSITAAELDKEIFIRNQGLTVADAIFRQLAHYPYHLGQIVFIGKMICNSNWVSLSIPKGNSTAYNAEKFEQPKHTRHFMDECFKKKEG